MPRSAIIPQDHQGSASGPNTANAQRMIERSNRWPLNFRTLRKSPKATPDYQYLRNLRQEPVPMGYSRRPGSIGDKSRGRTHRSHVAGQIACFVIRHGVIALTAAVSSALPALALELGLPARCTPGGDCFVRRCRLWIPDPMLSIRFVGTPVMTDTMELTFAFCRWLTWRGVCLLSPWQMERCFVGVTESQTAWF